MAKPEFIVQPQRSDGRAYVPCEIHQATSFAVIRVEKFTKKGRKYTASRVLDRFSSKTRAEGLAEANRKATEPLARHLIRKLGRRILKPETGED
jgi:hypothetical protein